MQEKILNNICYKEFTPNGKVKNTILILHWWWWSSDSWIKVWELLAKNWYAIIVPDLPWFWKTKLEKVLNLDDYSDIVLWFVRNLWIKNFILWWHSNWWAIAIKITNHKYIISHISTLVLNNSAWIRNDKKRSFKRKVFSITTKPVKFLSKFKIFKWLRNLFYRAIWSHDYLQAEKIPFLKETYLNMISTDLREEIKNLQVKTLLFWWEKDTYTPLNDWKWMNKNISNSKLIILQNEKHWIHLNSPEKLVETFLKSIKIN
jgi:pimeloyl-ACP methyl ester carboxylesterase